MATNLSIRSSWDALSALRYQTSFSSLATSRFTQDSASTLTEWRGTYMVDQRRSNETGTFARDYGIRAMKL